ncbi:hypothetical protein J4418_04750 [Candidatus Woesearchaeota archaeon]|nr:hypothetical protein [Candidatus Woesearchaeota archaeon]
MFTCVIFADKNELFNIVNFDKVKRLNIISIPKLDKGYGLFYNDDKEKYIDKSFSGNYLMFILLIFRILL